MSGEIHSKTIDGEKFQFVLMDVFEAAHLDVKVMELLAPLLGGLEKTVAGMDVLDLENIDIGKLDISFEDISKALIQSLGQLDRATQLTLIATTFKSVSWIGSEGALDLDSNQNINKAFAGKLMTMYKTLIEAWRFNKLTPFAVFGSIGEPSLTGILSAVSGKPKGNGRKLVKSEASTQG